MYWQNLEDTVNDHPRKLEKNQISPVIFTKKNRKDSQARAAAVDCDRLSAFLAFIDLAASASW
jgi:hypothetical protein